MLKRYTILKLLAVLLAFGLIAAACGDDDTTADPPADPPASDDGTADPPADPPAEDPPAEDPPAEDPPAEDPPADEPISVTLAIESEPTTLDPQITQDGGMRRVAENIYERLVEHDLDDPSILLPRLAAELPTLIDDTTWEVKIRPGVTFHNGEVFDAAAAKFAIDRELDPEFDSELLGQIDTITNVEVVDDSTIRITTVGPDPILPSRLYMIQMVPPDFTTNGDIAREAVGTGPYKMVEWVPGDHFDLERNDDYWGDAPQVETARFVFLPENQTRVAALQAGDVDMATGIAPESLGDVPNVLQREGLEYPYLRMKNYEGPLVDADLRRAIAHALPIDDYIEFIYLNGAARVNCQPLGAGVFGYNPALSDYEYDVDLATELVANSTYDGTPIRVVAPTGRWLKFEELSQAVASDMEKVGINVDFQLVPFDPWLQEFLVPFGEGQPDIAFSSTSNEIQDADRLSSLIGSGARVSSFDADDLEAAMTQARSTLDLDARRTQYQDILASNCEQVGVFPLLTFLDNYGVSDRLSWTPRYDGTARVEDMTVS